MRSLLVLALVPLTPVLASAAGPVCALLDPDKSPRVALLETKLLADPGATWVERATIDKVLAEQKLQALLGPQGVGERVKLGKLLRADLLVSVRPVKALKDDGTPDHVLEVAMSETAGGLRLLVRAVPVTESADADVAALLAVVRDGVKRHGQKVAEVVAVPPLLSQDLGHQHSYLKAAYARILEGAALSRPGVLVVELDEAEALAKEIALTAPGTAPARPPAVYLVGEYRHAGVGKELTVTLKLRAERGGKAVGEPITTVAKPDEAAAALRAWAGEVLKAAGPAGAADPKGEAKLLAARAREFRRLGFRAEALDLLEAAALTDPADPEWHLEALVTTRLLLKQRKWSLMYPSAVGFEAGLPLHRRGLEHLEAFVTKGGRPAGATRAEKQRSEYRVLGALLDYVGHTERFFLRRNFDQEPPANYPPQAREKYLADQAERRKRFDPIQAEHRELLFRVIPHVMKWDRPELGSSFVTGTYLPAGIAAETALLEMALFRLPVKEQYEVVERFVLGIKGVPDADTRVHGYLAVLWQLSDYNPLFDDLLKRLDAAGDEKIRAAVKLTRDYMPRWRKYTAEKQAVAVPNPADRPTTNGPPPRDPKLVGLTSLKLEFPAGVPLPPVRDWIPAGPGVDVISAGTAVYVMKEKGTLREVWTGNAGPALTFDGRFVWIAVGATPPNPRLAVLDPVTEKVHPVGEKHGLPEGTTLKPVAALGPGRVCAVGQVGGRTWVAVATFDPATGPAVKVIHEAKTTPDPRDKEWASAGVVFDPGEPVTYRKWPPGPKPELRVVVMRTIKRAESATSVTTDTPLFVDPDRERAEVYSDRGGTHTWVPADYPLAPDGSLYEVSRGSVWRVSPDGRRAEVAAGVLDSASAVERRSVFLHGARLHVIDYRVPWKKGPGGVSTHGQYEWWEFDPATGGARFLHGWLPNQPAFAVSAHYGPVLVGHARGGGTNAGKLAAMDPSNVYAATIPPPAKAAPAQPAEAVTFTAVTPKVKSGARAALTTLVAVGPGIDVLGGGDRVYVMKEKGVAKQVWAEDGSRTLLTFDGRYVWVVVERGEKEPGLFVLDPTAEKVYPVTAEHKLPSYTPGKLTGKANEKAVRPTILVAPIVPGRVCVAGSLSGNGKGQFGYGECWLGTATFDPAAGPAVAVRMSSAPNQPTRLDAMTRRTADGKEESWFRLARDHSGTHGREWVEPCIFYDPERPPLRLMASWKATEWAPTDELLGGNGVRYKLDGAKTYSMQFDGYPARATLCSVHAEPLTGVGPNGEKSEVAGLPQYDRFFAQRATLLHNGRLLISDGFYWREKRTADDPLGAAHWRFGLWEFDPATEQVRQLSVDAPPTARLAVSAHYGVVAIVGGVAGKFDSLGGTMPRMYALERTNPVPEK